MNGWDKKFLEMAKLVSSWSKDPSTKVGCVIADSDHAQLSEGFNGFPRGIADDDRLKQREIKLKLIVHAEANAIAAAARNGHRLMGATAYVTFCPCPQCAALLIQAGISRVITVAGATPEHWKAECELAQRMLAEAGVEFQEL
jgi:dCMP deaminase